MPFLILLLAGVVSLFSIVADRGTKASLVTDDSLQMQTVEQERMAAIYFRILSWLSDVMPRAVDPAKTSAQPAPKVVLKPSLPARQGDILLCALRSAQNVVAGKRRARNVN